MNLGNDGFSMGIGSGGTDISVGTIAGAVAGLKDAGKVTAAKLAALAGRNENVSTLNSVNMLGGTGLGFEQDIAKRIWEGELKVTYADLEEGELGSYVTGSDGITLSKTLLGGGKEGSAKLATVMSHEGTHANGIRTEAIAHLQGKMTYEAIKAVFGLRGDAEFSAGMIAAILDPASWVKNTGDTDYWTIYSFSNGFNYMADDGSKNLTVKYMDKDKNGDWTMIDEKISEMEKSSSIAQSLYQILGPERSAELLSRITGNQGTYFGEPGSAEYQENVGRYLMERSESISLTDRLTVDGYITTNINEDGMVDKFTVSATLLRMPASWDSEQGYGIAVKPGNNKALDTLIFTKRDLNGKLLDIINLPYTQSVDVYNTKDGEINRNQPYNVPFVDTEIQGNTIASNFSLLLDGLGTKYPMLIQNARTIADYWVDTKGLYDNNADNGGAWRLHWTENDYGGDGNRTSDGCFIPRIADVKMMDETLFRWGMRPDDHIYGTLIDTRAGVNKNLWQQYQ